jgi:prepilin-type N-terminal cleavage/methylation domain-containing protein
MNVWAKQKGFTIVELLIVVVLIAILAAITIISYNGIQNRARTAALQSAASQASKQARVYAAQNADLYPPDKATFLSIARLADTSDTVYDYLVSPDRTHYCVSATSVSNPSFSTAASDTSGGTVEGRCVRNLATNPNLEVNDTDWSNGYASQWARRADSSMFGSYTIAQLPNGTDTSYLYYRNTPVEAGKEYTVSLTGKVFSAATRTLFLNISWRDASSTGVSSSNGSANAQTLASGQSARFFVQGVAPGNAITGWVQTRSNSPSGSDEYRWDGLMFTEGNAQYQFADGSFAGWSWDGAPNSSSSFGPAKLQ